MRKPHIHRTTPSSKKLLWLSDLHLDQANHPLRYNLFKDLKNADYDAVLITGDTAASDSLAHHLSMLAAACDPKPLYFILGNHDFYMSDLKTTLKKVRELSSEISNLHHLQDLGVVWLTPDTALVGHHGWADARIGWGNKTYVRSPDHWCIDDFRILEKSARFDLMGKLGQESTRSIRRNLNAALLKATTLIVATHFPAFKTSAHYNGTPCGPCHTPHYVHASLGGMLIGTACQNLTKRFTVLSGHTHSEIRENILANLESRVAGTKRGYPQIQGILPL